MTPDRHPSPPSRRPAGGPRRLLVVAALGLAALGAQLAPAAARGQPVVKGAPAPSASGAVAAPTVVLVMRHAERADAGGSATMAADPALSEAGAARARAFAGAVGEGEVRAVYVTQYRRTRDTGAPIAEEAGVPVIERPVTAANAAGYAAALAREIRERHAGQTVAVVGHSNTVPEIVAALSGRAAPALTERDYGDVFVVVLAPPGGGTGRVLRLRAGI